MIYLVSAEIVLEVEAKSQKVVKTKALIYLKKKIREENLSEKDFFFTIL